MSHKFIKKKIILSSKKTFKKKLNFLIESSKWNTKDINKYLNDQFILTLKYAFKNSEYYKNLFKKNNLKINDFKSLKDIVKLPFLTKKIIRINKNIKINKKNDQKTFYMTTGGTTGDPLKIWMNDSYKEYSLACTYFYMNKLGFNISKDKSVRIHGDTIKQSLINKSIYWVKDKHNAKKLIMSSYHINNKTINDYLEQIKKHKPIYMHCYPSVIFLLANIIKSKKIIIDFKLKGIITDSEKLYKYQIKLITKVFNCPVYSIYGHTEGAVFGYPNNIKSNKFHIHHAVGYCELIDKNSKIIKKTGIKGEVVVTGFLNNVFPLIRYRTQDYATYFKKNGQIVLDSIYGRKQDFIINKELKKVPIGPALFDYNFDWSGIEKFQIEQNYPGKLNIQLVYLDKNKNNIN